MPRAAVAVEDTVSIDADDDSAKMLAEVKAAGLEVGALKEEGEKMGADIRVKAYHAFNGQVWEGPLYMTTGEGGSMSIFKYKFTQGQIDLNPEIDPKWLGKRVWYADPQPVQHSDGKLMCRYSVDLPAEQKAQLQSDGFYAFCRNDARFRTPADEEYHVEKRHPKWFKNAAEREKKVAALEAAADAKTTREALVALIQNLKEK